MGIASLIHVFLATFLAARDTAKGKQKLREMFIKKAVLDFSSRSFVEFQRNSVECRDGSNCAFIGRPTRPRLVEQLTLP